MLLKLSRAFITETGIERLREIGIDASETIRYGKTSLHVDADEMIEEHLVELQKIAAGSKQFGAKTIAYDVNILLKTLKDIKDTKGKGFLKVYLRRVEHFATYLKKYLQTVKVHRIYQHDSDRGIMQCYYIYDIEYHPPVRHKDYTSPEYVDFTLAWKEFGEVETKTVSFYYNDCMLTNVKDAMQRKHFYFADSATDKQYEEYVEKFNTIVENVGEQYLASGAGTDDVEEDSNRYWWRRYSESLVLDRDGIPSNVVIDVFKEDDKEESSNRHRRSEPDLAWWLRLGGKSIDLSETTEEPEELPIHPNLVIFTMKKQKRLRVHVGQLTKYTYDRKMGDKLILPKESKELVETLLEYEGGFEDLIKDKGGGAIVLCTGPAGTGKTLTAEVFAEVMEKPLYTVQCSQLGVTPDDLETELLKVFGRAERWKAILLLDEADVYIRQRGDDINQNAIVGVFLRVMEYYKGVMFMTTNRQDIIEDAIASRCIAKITYTFPANEKAAVDLWMVLADVQGVSLTKQIATQLVRKHGYNCMSGRDIKNLLKLAKLVMNKKKNKSLSVETIEFVKMFKPTE